MSTAPANLAVKAAMVSVLKDGMNGYLRTMGAADVLESAFQDEVIGDPSVETVCIAYSGTRRGVETGSLRDQEIVLSANVWALGVGCQQRAMQLEAAIVAAIDADELYSQENLLDTYLDGTCTQPLTVGNSVSRTLNEDDAANMIWQLAFPVLCPTRTLRPELEPTDAP